MLAWPCQVYFQEAFVNESWESRWVHSELAGTIGHLQHHASETTRMLQALALVLLNYSKENVGTIRKCLGRLYYL